MDSPPNTTGDLKQPRFSPVHPRRWKLIAVLALLILLIAIPLTLYLIGQKQDIRQRAAGVACSIDTVDVVLVIDTSNSMIGAKLDEAKAAATLFTNTVLTNSKNRVGIATFDNNGGLKIGLTNSASSVNGVISSLTTPGAGEGGTCLECAIDKVGSGDVMSAFSTGGDIGNKRHVIILTDGLINRWMKADGTITGSTSSSDEQQARDQALAAVNNVRNTYGSVFSAIQYYGSANRDWLQNQIVNPPGTFLSNDMNGSITDMYTKMANQLMGGTIIAFVYNDQNNNGIKDSSEGPLANVSVTLNDGISSAPGASTGQTVAGVPEDTSLVSRVSDLAVQKAYAAGCNSDNGDRPNGCQCNANDKCWSNICSGGVCVGRPNGDSCNDNGKCASGYCQSPNNGGFCANPPQPTSPPPTNPPPTNTPPPSGGGGTPNPTTKLTGADGKAVFNSQCNVPHYLVVTPLAGYIGSTPLVKNVPSVPEGGTVTQNFGLLQPTATPTFTPTPKPTNTPTPTATVSPTAKPTVTNIPTPTTVPSATPSPTRTPTPTNSPTPVPGSSAFTISLLIHGIGSSGDNVLLKPDGCQRTNGSLPNPAKCFSNEQPLTPTRTINLEIINLDNAVIAHPSGTIVYDPAYGGFKGTVPFTAVPSGKYLVKVRIPSSLKKQLPQTITLTAGQTLAIPEFDLTPVDVDGDNKLSVLDYNQIVECYTFPGQPASCPVEKAKLVDVNDDGANDEFDNNLFKRDLSVLYGQ